MSVLSKALHLAVFASLIVGCSAQRPVFDNDQTNNINAATADAESAPQPSVAAPGENVAPTTDQLATVAQSGLDISLTRGQGATQIAIAADNANARFDVFEMSNPSRIVVDIPGGTAVKPGTLMVDSAAIRSLRLGSHADKGRVVVDISNGYQERLNFTQEQVEGRLILTFNDTGDSPALPAAEQTTADSAPNIGESSGSEQLAAAAIGETATIENVQFYKTQGSSGEVTVTLSNAAPFNLRHTAPTEYTLEIQNATATQQATIPQIAPVSASGIRSARATQEGNNVLVRMFVDSNVALNAVPRGSEILVTANLEAKNPEARAQLQQPTEEAAAPAADSGPGYTVDATDDKARTNPTGVLADDGSKTYTGRLISLDLQETDIDNALRIIAEVSNLNIIASDDVTGKVTLRLIDVPWDQALDVILKTNGLDQVTEGNVIRIAPVEKLRQEREALREAKKSKEMLEDLKVRYVRVSYARAADLKEQVESVLTERGSVTVDERTNQLIVKDIAKGQEEMMELIKKLDLRTPQVLLETQIVEAGRGLLRDLGFQWNFLYAQTPATGNATGMNFPNSIVVGGGNPAGNAVNFPAAVTDDGAGSALGVLLGSADGSRLLTMRLSALETENKVRVISRPQVATINNKEAEIKSVETIRVRLPSSGTSVATGSGATASAGGSAAFEEIDVGITLRVTPQASPDYYVLLDVNATSSTFGTHPVDGVPSTLDREATSTVLVKSGQTFALGGVYRINDRESVDGVPFLKDVPVLGTFFRRYNMDKSDQELIFFITPHIVEGSFDPSLM